MRRLGTAITFGLMLVGTAAQAQIGPINESASTTLIFPRDFTPPNFKSFGETAASGDTYTQIKGAKNFGGSDFFSFVDQGGGTVTFESSNVTSGIGVQTSSSSLVSFTFDNTTGGNVDFESLITPAGLGFYLADLDSGCQYSNCGEVMGSGADLTLLRPSSNGFIDDETGIALLGLAGFDFSITDTYDGGSQTYRVYGDLALKYDSNTGVTFIDPIGFAPIGASLLGFTRTTGASDAAAIGYAWDATPVSLSLGQGLHTLTYSTEVHSWSQAATLDCGASLIAFSGFGDPIGRGGGGSALRAARLSGDCAPGGPIKGVTFTENTFQAPRLDGGALVFNKTGLAAIPEPATWGMLIMGFGGIGAAMRRRRTLGAHA